MDPMAMFLGVIAIISVTVVAIVMLRYLNGPNLDPKKIAKLGVTAIDLAEKLNHILTTHRLWSEEGTYTFPDGDTWHKEG